MTDSEKIVELEYRLKMALGAIAPLAKAYRRALHQNKNVRGGILHIDNVEYPIALQTLRRASLAYRMKNTSRRNKVRDT